MPDLTPSPMVVELSDTTLKKLADLIRQAIEDGAPMPYQSIEVERLTTVAQNNMKDAVLAALDEHDQP